MSSGNHVRSHNHDVKRQLFLGITKKMKSSSSMRSHNNNKHHPVDELSSPSIEQTPQFLHSSTSHTIPKSPRSRRLAQHLFTPTSTFNLVSNNNNNNASISVDSDSLRSLPTLVKSDDPQMMTKFVLHKKQDINDYDYHTFSSKHSLRTSKVKLLEQAEVTANLYFNFELNDGIEEVLNEEEFNDILICLPGLDRESTKIAVEQFQHNFQISRRGG